jgi:hypothetical protein
MRATSKLVLVTSIVATIALFAGAMPASAAVTGAGSVVGTVTINGSGIPTVTQAKELTTYSFGAVNITGVFRSANGGTFIGTIKIPAGVQGGTVAPGENTLGGKGTVNPFAISGSGGVGTISGTCGGTFSRNVSIVVVALGCNVSVAGKPAQAAKVTVVANFTPTSGNGATTRVKQASFAGVYASK